MIHPSFWVLVSLFVSVSCYFKGRALSERADYLLSLEDLPKKERIEGLCMRADSLLLAFASSIGGLVTLAVLLYACGAFK